MYQLQLTTISLTKQLMCLIKLADMLHQIESTGHLQININLSFLNSIPEKNSLR